MREEQVRSFVIKASVSSSFGGFIATVVATGVDETVDGGTGTLFIGTSGNFSLIFC
jgi:hypothetical protein